VYFFFFFFFFQAEDGIRDKLVTGVQTCALPISAAGTARSCTAGAVHRPDRRRHAAAPPPARPVPAVQDLAVPAAVPAGPGGLAEIGRASCRERGEGSGGGGHIRKE